MTTNAVQIAAADWADPAECLMLADHFIDEGAERSAEFCRLLSRVAAGAMHPLEMCKEFKDDTGNTSNGVGNLLLIARAWEKHVPGTADLAEGLIPRWSRLDAGPEEKAARAFRSMGWAFRGERVSNVRLWTGTTQDGRPPYPANVIGFAGGHSWYFITTGPEVPTIPHAVVSPIRARHAGVLLKERGHRISILRRLEEARESNLYDLLISHH
jgi:hypothetical protein